MVEVEDFCDVLLERDRKQNVLLAIAQKSRTYMYAGDFQCIELLLPSIYRSRVVVLIPAPLDHDICVLQGTGNYHRVVGFFEDITHAVVLQQMIE